MLKKVGISLYKPSGNARGFNMYPFPQCINIADWFFLKSIHTVWYWVFQGTSRAFDIHSLVVEIPKQSCSLKGLSCDGKARQVHCPSSGNCWPEDMLSSVSLMPLSQVATVPGFSVGVCSFSLCPEGGQLQGSSVGRWAQDLMCIRSYRQVLFMSYQGVFPPSHFL